MKNTSTIMVCIMAAGIVACHAWTLSDTANTDLTQRYGVSVSMSSQHPGASGYTFPGSRAVDGMKVPPLIPGPLPDFTSIAHTLNEQSPWIQIDLAQHRCIKGVKIWNRSNSPNGSVLGRFRNAKITVSNGSGGERATQCAYSAGSQPAVRYHQCSRVICGRYVRVTAQNANNWLNLYEIEVHGW